jgi:hypothetical protein
MKIEGVQAISASDGWIPPPTPRVFRVNIVQVMGPYTFSQIFRCLYF